MFEQASAPTERNVISDWFSRGGITLFFVLAGADKFTPAWVKLFHEHPADSVFSGTLFIALTLYGWNRRNA